LNNGYIVVFSNDTHNFSFYDFQFNEAALSKMSLENLKYRGNGSINGDPVFLFSRSNYYDNTVNIMLYSIPVTYLTGAAE